MNEIIKITTNENGEHHVSSQIVAQELGIHHKNVLELINTHLETIESEFGRVAFETREFKTAQGNKSKERIAHLTEDQGIAVGTLSQGKRKRYECKPCNDERSRVWYKNNKESVLEKSKNYYEVNREKILLKNKENYAKNINQARDKKRDYTNSNKDKINETKRAYRAKNKSKINERQRKYKQENKEKFKEYQIKYRSLTRKNAKKWFQKNKDKVIQYGIKKIDLLSDSYVINKLKRQTGLSEETIKKHPSLIEVKRLIIQNKRTIKNQNK